MQQSLSSSSLSVVVEVLREVSRCLVNETIGEDIVGRGGNLVHALEREKEPVSAFIIYQGMS